MKSYTTYFEKDGKYYKQDMVWWEKGGYFVPQRAKKITRECYKHNKITGTKTDA